MSENNRRFEDTTIGKLTLSWPMIIGICTLLVALGLTLATVGEHTIAISTIFKWHEEGRAERAKLSEAVVQIKDFTEQQKEFNDSINRRMSSIEDWRNGVSDVYVTGHHKH